MLFTLRKHWKKSIFAACLVSYGFHYSSQRYREYLVRRQFFLKAKKYGEEFINPLDKPRRLYVILNPAACNRKAKTLFQKNAAPLFHLAGIDVTYIQTDYEGHAKTIVNYFDPTIDGIVVAGGNGTIQEIVTGMLRQDDRNPIVTVPVGVIPIGEKSNALFKRLFGSDVVNVRAMCEAALAVVEGKSKKVNVVEVKTDQKSIFALNSIHVGLHQEVKEKIDAGKYWLLGPLRSYFACFWKSIKNWPPVDDSIKIICPSSTLSTVDQNSNQNNFMLNSAACLQEMSAEQADGSNLVDEVSTSGVSIWLDEKENKSQFLVQIVTDDLTRGSFITHRTRWIKNDFKYTPSEYTKTLICDELSLTPSNVQGISYDIDGEIFDGRPIKIFIHPRQLNMFCPK